MTDHVHPDEVAEVVSQPETEIRWFGVLLVIGHLALLVLGAISLWNIGGGGWPGGVAAGIFALAYLVLWRFLLAPGSRARLGLRERLTLAFVIGPAVVVLGSLANLWLPALVATAVVILGESLNESRPR